MFFRGGKSTKDPVAAELYLCLQFSCDVRVIPGPLDLVAISGLVIGSCFSFPSAINFFPFHALFILSFLHEWGLKTSNKWWPLCSTYLDCNEIGSRVYHHISRRDVCFVFCLFSLLENVYFGLLVLASQSHDRSCTSPLRHLFNCARVITS